MTLRFVRITLAAIPVIFLLLIPLFIRGTEPRVLGMPPLMAWVTFSILVTPFCLWAIERLRARR